MPRRYGRVARRNAVDAALRRQTALIADRAALKSQIDAAGEHAVIVLTVWDGALPDVTIVSHPDDDTPATRGLAALSLAHTVVCRAAEQYARQVSDAGGDGGGVVRF